MTRGRFRLPLVWLGVLTAFVAAATDAVPGWIGLVALVMAIAVYTRLAGPRTREPVAVLAPVSGRWRVVNSPADRVPSHGLHAYGQTFAIDLVGEPQGVPRPHLGWWPPARRPADFPGFGAPVLAPASGVVVEAHDRARDHWSRTSYLALLYVVGESVVRELGGPPWLFGNRVVLAMGDGLYAVVAHLRRGSLRVGPGEVVAGGDHIADCGNSGNSTEPHVHFQLMDHRSPLLADGVPFVFCERGPSGESRSLGVPGRTAPFVAHGPRARAGSLRQGKPTQSGERSRGGVRR